MTTAGVLHNPHYPDWVTDAHLTGAPADTRNVIDYYKGWETAAIREDVAARSFPLVVLLEGFLNDFNLATAVRSSNAFGARRVHIIGRRKWDRRGAVGVHHYTPVEHERDIAGLYDRYRADGYQIVAVDNIDGAVPLGQHSWQSKTLLVFGQEGVGVSNLSLGYADAAVAIPQWGSVRSLNVGVASGIVLHDYATRCGALLSNT